MSRKKAARAATAMGELELENALRLRRTWFYGARLAARVVRTSAHPESRAHRRSVRAVARTNDAVVITMCVQALFLGTPHSNAVELALFMRDLDARSDVTRRVDLIKSAARRCFGTAKLSKGLETSSIGQAIRLVAVVPEFVEVLARCTMNQPPVLHKDASKLAIDMYKSATRSGTWPVFVSLCRESPATLAESWELASLLSHKDAPAAS